MKYHYLTAGLVLLMACGQKTSIPSDVLQPDTMVQLLIGLHHADARVSNLRISKDSAYVVMRHYELYLYDQHEVSEEEYLSSKQWYLSHPEVYVSLYERVVDSLNTMEETVRPEPRNNNADSVSTNQGNRPRPNRGNRPVLVNPEDEVPSTTMGTAEDEEDTDDEDQE